MQNRTGVVCFWLSSLVGVNQIWTEKAMAPHSSILPGKSHGQRSLVGCSAWGCEESDTTERLHFHFSLSCIGEGNGSPLQCSCLENPRDSGAWWAAIYGVSQSRTQLKRLSSSSSSSNQIWNREVYHLGNMFKRPGLTESCPEGEFCF